MNAVRLFVPVFSIPEAGTDGGLVASMETDNWNVFIDHTNPTAWTLTGRFGQIFLDGRLIYLQSGLIGFDPLTGALSDPHPGPNGTYPDTCTILGP